MNKRKHLFCFFMAFFCTVQMILPAYAFDSLESTSLNDAYKSYTEVNVPTQIHLRSNPEDFFSLWNIDDLSVKGLYQSNTLPATYSYDVQISEEEGSASLQVRFVINNQDIIISATGPVYLTNYTDSISLIEGKLEGTFPVNGKDYIIFSSFQKRVNSPGAGAGISVFPADDTGKTVFFEI